MVTSRVPREFSLMFFGFKLSTLKICLIFTQQLISVCFFPLPFLILLLRVFISSSMLVDYDW